jgi:tRNA 2-thiouridine synthesizing protein A
MEVKPDEVFDLRGEICPMPVLKTRGKLERLKSGQVLEVIVDYPAAKENIKRAVEKEGSQVLKVEERGKDIHIFIKKGRDRE